MKLLLLSSDHTRQIVGRALSETIDQIDHVNHIESFYARLLGHKPTQYNAVIIEDSVTLDGTHSILLGLKNYLAGVIPIILTQTKQDYTDTTCLVIHNNELGLKRLTQYLQTLPEENESADRSLPQINNDEKTLKSLYNKYKTLVNGAGEAIIGLNEKGLITFVNPEACELFNQKDHLLLNKHFSEFAFDSPLIEGASAESFTDAGRSQKRIGRGTIKRGKRDFIYVEYTQTFVGNKSDDTVSIMVVEDISDRIKFETKLKALANKDMLTGLYNRYYFHRVFEQELRSKRGKNHLLAVAVIDLDGFKKINDNHGHQVGDQLLNMMGKRLRENIRRGDLAARIGGDEFVVLFRESDVKDLYTICQNLLDNISQPVKLSTCTLSVSASIGVSMVDSRLDGTVKYYLEKADEAMYSVKRENKNGVAVYQYDTNKKLA